MNKLIAILVLLVLACSLVLAQDQDNGSKAKDKEQREKEVKPPKLVEGVKVPNGLTNALSNVKNENARQQLQQNIIKFQENYQQRLEKMEDVEIEGVDEETGAVEIKAKEPVKYFGFITGKATKRFSINAEGKIAEKAPWYKLFYTETTSE